MILLRGLVPELDGAGRIRRNAPPLRIHDREVVACRGDSLRGAAGDLLPEATQERLKKDMEALQEQLQSVVKKLPEWEREHRHQIRELDREVTRYTVSTLIGSLRERHADLEAVVSWLDSAGAT